MTAAELLGRAESEAALGEAWAAVPRVPLRLADGRRLRVIFPGVSGGPSGPDFRGAILDAGGDILRGDVELHLRSSGWRGHGHHADPAYAGVVLHVVSLHDRPEVATAHNSGRAIPILVLPLQETLPFPPPFTPPCALATANGLDLAPVLQRLGTRRLRIKASRVAPLIASDGPGQALYTLLLEVLGGPANRAAFAAIARRMPLAALLERADGSSATRALALTAELKGAAGGVILRRAGLRPLAAPGRRLDSAGALFARLWPADAAAGWPTCLTLDALPRALSSGGCGRALAVELAVNAVLPVLLAAGGATDTEVLTVYHALPSPGTYGKLKPLSGWLGSGGTRAFHSASTLQGGLLLHADYCTKGYCGRCPLSE